MAETSQTPRPIAGRKLAAVAVLVSLTLGLSGFFMALRQTAQVAEDTRSKPVSEATRETTVPELDVPVAPRYSELPGRLHPNAAWVLSLNTLVRPNPGAQYIPAILDVAEQERLRGRRVSRRMYDGAPPVAPHPLDQRSPAACLECHGRPTQIGSISVPQISHAQFTNCIQCHVSSVGPSSWWMARNESLSDGNRFAGKELSGKGTRAYTGAPPTVPHTTWMRDNCMSCHGPGGTVALRTPHPDRQSCSQCHAPNAVLDSRMAAGLPPPLPAGEWKTNLAN
jgi:cytochrome c-type protein NapB